MDVLEFSLVQLVFRFKNITAYFYILLGYCKFGLVWFRVEQNLEITKNENNYIF